MHFHHFVFLALLYIWWIELTIWNSHKEIVCYIGCLFGGKNLRTDLSMNFLYVVYSRCFILLSLTHSVLGCNWCWSYYYLGICWKIQQRTIQRGSFRSSYGWEWKCVCCVQTRWNEHVSKLLCFCIKIQSGE